jgi:hypothetical protein
VWFQQKEEGSVRQWLIAVTGCISCTRGTTISYYCKHYRWKPQTMSIKERHKIRHRTGYGSTQECRAMLLVRALNVLHSSIRNCAGIKRMDLVPSWRAADGARNLEELKRRGGNKRCETTANHVKQKRTPQKWEPFIHPTNHLHPTAHPTPAAADSPTGLPFTLAENAVDNGVGCDARRSKFPGNHCGLVVRTGCRMRSRVLLKY